MKTIHIGVSPLMATRLAYGCWRLAGNKREGSAESRSEGRRAVMAAYEAGYTLFDNADIYAGGEAESIFGAVLKEVPGMRDRIVVATKGGIRPAGDPTPDAPGRYDFSAQHLIGACERSLQRLGVETIDIYMLHRPDLLADPAEVAGAFSELKRAGKVRFFGVSNFQPTLVTALQAACPMPLVVHQVEISLAKLDAFTDGTLDQCLVENLLPMAWSPLAAGLIGAGAQRLLPSQQGYQTEKFLPTLETIAKAHGTTRVVVALAWLLRHPANIMPIVGTVNPERIRDATRADELQLSREEWYRLLIAARGEPMP